VGEAFFPLDEELGLLSSGVTPRAEEIMVRLASWMPFEQARALLEELTGVRVSKESVRRATLLAGAAGLAVDETETERLRREVPEVPEGAENQAMSADGAFVPLVGGVWAEVKTMVLGEVTRNQQGEVCTQQLSSFSRLCDAQHFEEATLLETHRRGLEKAIEVCAVQDGAEWLPGLVDHHRADAVRILDFAHAAEHLGEVAQAAKEAGSALADDWLSKQLHELKHQGPSQVLAQVRALVARHPEVKVLRDQLAYLQKREAQMQYPAFQAAGWPIGSGSVESANKVIVEARRVWSGYALGSAQRQSHAPLTQCSRQWAMERDLGGIRRLSAPASHDPSTRAESAASDLRMLVPRQPGGTTATHLSTTCSGSDLTHHASWLWLFLAQTVPQTASVYLCGSN